MRETAEALMKQTICSLERYRGEMTEAQLYDILEISAKAIRAQAGTFWFYHRFEDGLIRPLAVYGGEKLQNIYILPGEGISGMVIDTGEPILIADCQDDPRWTKKVDVETGFVTKSTLCVPMKISGMVFGSIQLVNKEAGDSFNETDQHVLQAIADHVADMLTGKKLLGEYNSISAPKRTLELENDTRQLFINRLAAYMDPFIIHEILRSDGKHKKSIQPQDAVVLFADIRGFTGLAQKITSSQLISALSDFLAITSHQVHAYGGIIDKFMGDCTMAYWRCEDNPQAAWAACACAMAIQKEAKAFTDQLLRQTGIQIGIGIGIHIGPVLICHVGDEQYMAYTIIGSSVNTACRIEEHALSETVYISGEVAEALGDTAVTAAVEHEIYWRGMDENLVVLELKDIKL